MCDYSLMHLKSRDAEKNEKLRTSQFIGGSIGFVGTEPDVAVCVRPGTCLAFDAPAQARLGYYAEVKTYGVVGWFRQVEKYNPSTHHDAIEFDTGEVIKLCFFLPDQSATVMLLPEAPKTPLEAAEQERIPVTA
jgi:hypothetical protein